MSSYEIAWDDLKKSLKNQSACDRYENGYREEKPTDTMAMTESEMAAYRLKQAMNRGVVYGNARTVRKF